MFKFLKSKKGFTLVELMIVVVIMAILVAVAVPIYNAVTANAKKKTCIGNQRQFISVLGNWLMLQTAYDINGTFTTSGGTDAPKWDDFTGNISNMEKEITGLFQTIPVCPDPTAKIEITVVPGASESTKATVETKCINGTNSNEHKIPNLE